MRPMHHDSKIIDRFFSKVQKSEDPDGCWGWVGKISASGQAMFTIGKKVCTAAQFSYTLHKEQLPVNTQVTKTCKNGLCTNPKHLDLRVDPKSLTPEQRFQSKIKLEGECWIWTGKASNSSPLLYLNGGWVVARRFIYELRVSPIPENHYIHASCGNDLCCNSEHLYTSPDPKGRTAEERFWEKVDKTPGYGPDGDCWKWTGKTDKRETHCYGKFWLEDKWVRPHRYVYELANDCKIPDKMVIRHQCDNVLCCNPAHLLIGTQADNVADMIARNRTNHAKGEQVNTCKLTEAQVREIKKHHVGRHGDSSRLAREYGVSAPTIDAIIRGNTWKHVV